MTFVPPSVALAPFVRAFLLVEVEHDTTRVRMPDAHLVLGLRYRGAASVVSGAHTERLPDTSLAGVARRARTMRTDAGSGVALAIFHPGGAARFFDAPLHELHDVTVDLADLAPVAARRNAIERVAEARNGRGRVAAVERFLLALAQRRLSEPDALVQAAVRAIDEARGRVRVDALARALHTSVDPLEKRFRRTVGTTPKAYASLLRLQHAIALHEAGVSLARIATAAGFYDQAHFTRAFRAAFGEPPGRFLRAGAGPRA